MPVAPTLENDLLALTAPLTGHDMLDSLHCLLQNGLRSAAPYPSILIPLTS